MAGFNSLTDIPVHGKADKLFHQLNTSKSQHEQINIEIYIVFVYPLVVLVCLLVALVCPLVVLVCPLVVLVCSLIVSVCPLVVLSVGLFITDP